MRRSHSTSLLKSSRLSGESFAVSTDTLASVGSTSLTIRAMSSCPVPRCRWESNSLAASRTSERWNMFHNCPSTFHEMWTGRAGVLRDRKGRITASRSDLSAPTSHNLCHFLLPTQDLSALRRGGVWRVSAPSLASGGSRRDARTAPRAESRRLPVRRRGSRAARASSCRAACNPT